eukprot:5999157-Karenia_brevis.AAC.1
MSEGCFSMKDAPLFEWHGCGKPFFVQSLVLVQPKEVHQIHHPHVPSGPPYKWPLGQCPPLLHRCRKQGPLLKMPNVQPIVARRGTCSGATQAI